MVTGHETIHSKKLRRRRSHGDRYTRHKICKCEGGMQNMSYSV
jgi:hypothetical protein